MEEEEGFLMRGKKNTKSVLFLRVCSVVNFRAQVIKRGCGTYTLIRLYVSVLPNMLTHASRDGPQRTNQLAAAHIRMSIHV